MVSKVILVCAALVCAVSASANAPSYAAPVIVPSLRALARPSDKTPPSNLHPLPYPNNDEHPYVGQLHNIQSAIETHQNEMAKLEKDLAEAQAHRNKLLQAQKLAHAMVSLHQSESVLALIDHRVESVKQEVKKIGEAAEDAARERDDLQRQLKESLGEDDKKLLEIRKQLKHLESVLRSLCDKRSEVAGVVGEWRSFVDDLRAAHGLPPRKGGDAPLAIPALPHPPSEEEEEQEEEKEKEEEITTKMKAEVDAEKAKGVAAAAGSGSEEEAEVKKAPVQEITGGKTADDAKEDPSAITAKPHEIAATASSIDELLNVHVPKLTGQAHHAHTPRPASFVEVSETTDLARVRRNRHIE